MPKFLTDVGRRLNSRYGVSVDLYCINSASTDPLTGIRSKVTLRKSLKAIVFEDQNTITELFNGAFSKRAEQIMATANIADVVVLVPKKELGSWVVATKQYFVIDEKKYVVENFENYGEGIIFAARRTNMDAFNVYIELSIMCEVIATQGATIP